MSRPVFIDYESGSATPLVFIISKFVYYHRIEMNILCKKKMCNKRIVVCVEWLCVCLHFLITVMSVHLIGKLSRIVCKCNYE